MARKERSEDARGVTNAEGLKARVERAALELFAREGVDGVSIKQVAGAAGISDGAMYRYYKSKDALAAALFETIHVRLYNLLEAALARQHRHVTRRTDRQSGQIE